MRNKEINCNYSNYELFSAHLNPLYANDSYMRTLTKSENSDENATECGIISSGSKPFAKT